MSSLSLLFVFGLFFLYFPCLNLASLTILGASYGLADETTQISNMVSGNQLSFNCNNAVLGDGWPGQRKACTVIYSDDYTSGASEGTIFSSYVAIVEEGQTLTITSSTVWPKHTKQVPAPGELLIIGASYGKQDETGTCAAHATSTGLTIQAHNSVFGDGWPGVKKTLTVVSQKGSSSPDTDIASEDNWLTI